MRDFKGDSKLPLFGSKKKLDFAVGKFASHESHMSIQIQNFKHNMWGEKCNKPFDETRVRTQAT